ncbi:hypothetical protein PT974_00409 [Cladobotryum mycophilum]|uniref:Transcription factor domain-containing protein n=1 Tax=Cladobotryum mycophilum TaxID=491253 RepID=A0ABR0T0S5_9HYPO
MQRNESPADVDDQYTSTPKRVGSDLSLVNFPVEIQPYIQGDLAQAYLDLCRGRPQSPITQFHLLKTLRLLQKRLDMPDDPCSISDATIMVVSVLALIAEHGGDVDAVRNHMQGLRRMVDLRGRLEMLRFENSRLPAKVCRVDLSLAFRFGTKPMFFSDALSWEPFIWDGGLIGGSSKFVGTNEDVSVFIKTLDEKMINIWNDLREFAWISNLAQTTYKLQPNTFSEIMVSVLYRLLNFSFPEGPILEAMRLAMTVFAAGIFFQWRGIRQRLSCLDDDLQGTLLKLKTSEICAPPMLIA